MAGNQKCSLNELNYTCRQMVSVAKISLNVLLNPKRHFTSFSPCFEGNSNSNTFPFKHINMLDVKFSYIKLKISRTHLNHLSVA